MSDLICWNCNSRTPVGICTTCGVEVKSADEIYKEKEAEIKKQVIEIRRKGRKAFYLNLNELNEIVSKSFKIIRSLHLESPKYVVEDPGMVLTEKFETLFSESDNLLTGLTPKVQRIAKDSEHLLIQYAFIEPITNINNRRSVILIFLTFFSMLLSGFVNNTNVLTSRGIDKSGFSILRVDVSFDALLYSLQFSLTLLFILLIKDVIQIQIAKRYFNVKLQTFFVPSPPIFELGTIGSFVGNLSIHKSKNSMFYTYAIGPLIAWFLSILILVISIQYALINDPVVVDRYSNYSILQNGNYEPIILKYIIIIGNSLTGADISTDSAITKTYLLNPVTMAALAGVYISGLSMLPISFLNGGQIARAKLGRLPNVFLTYIVIVFTIFYSAIFAFFLILVHQRLGVPEILNEESKSNFLSHILFFIAILIALLTIPIPVDRIY